jgi:hypothetical protein
VSSDSGPQRSSRVQASRRSDSFVRCVAPLDNQTELPISKHTTDTAGYSDLFCTKASSCACVPKHPRVLPADLTERDCG